MSRRVAAATTLAKAPAKKRTIQPHDEAAHQLNERRKSAHEAAAWAFANGVGSNAALREAQFKDRGLMYNMMEPLLREHKPGGKKQRVDAPRDHPSRAIITDRSSPMPSE